MIKITKYKVITKQVRRQFFVTKKTTATEGQELERLPTMIIVICIKSVPLRTANSNL
jgi:hypothetical protein